MKEMSKLEIFDLYKKVLAKDRNAEIILIEQHKMRFPNNQFHVRGLTRSNCIDFRRELDTMYHHLYMK